VFSRECFQSKPKGKGEKKKNDPATQNRVSNDQEGNSLSERRRASRFWNAPFPRHVQKLRRDPVHQGKKRKKEERREKGGGGCV